MIRKTLVASVIAGLLTIGAAPAAQAQPPVPVPQWIPIFYFGTQTYCTQVGAMGQQSGALTPGRWKCDSGWLMVQPPTPS